MGSQMLTNAQQITINLSATVTSQALSFFLKLIGKTHSKILYFCFTIPFKHSTWVCTWDNSLDSWTSLLTDELFPWWLQVTSLGAFHSATSSNILKPRLAKTKSPGKSLLRIPYWSVITLSETHPPHSFDTNDIVPWGVIPNKHLMVLWDLYVDHVWNLARRLECHSMKTSVQTIMTTVFKSLAWKDSDNVAQTSSLEGHQIRNFSVVCNIVNHLRTVCVTVLSDTPKRYPKSFFLDLMKD